MDEMEVFSSASWRLPSKCFCSFLGLILWQIGEIDWLRAATECLLIGVLVKTPLGVGRALSFLFFWGLSSEECSITSDRVVNSTSSLSDVIGVICWEVICWEVCNSASELEGDPFKESERCGLVHRFFLGDLHNLAGEYNYFFNVTAAVCLTFLLWWASRAGVCWEEDAGICWEEDAGVCFSSEEAIIIYI